MKPDTSRWRDQSQYDFYDALPVEGIAWECLRRNAAYQASFDDIVAQDAGEHPLSDDAQHHWGLRFPRTTRSVCPTATGGVVAAERSRRPLSDSAAELSAVKLKQPRRQVRCRT